MRATQRAVQRAVQRAAGQRVRRAGTGRFIAALVALWAASVFASAHAHAQVVTLAELERAAVRGRPALDADDAATRAAQADVDRALASYYPVVSVEGRTAMSPGAQLVTILVPGSDAPVLVSGTRPGLDEDALRPRLRYNLALEARSNLYDFGRTAASVEASRAKRRAVDAGRDVTRFEIVRAVRGTYLAWLAASELVSVSERAATDAAERSQRVTALIAEGMRPRADLTPVKSDELLAQLELERARSDLSRRQLSLEHAVGSPLPEGAIPDRTLLDELPATSRRRDDPHLRTLELERTATEATARAFDEGDSPVLSGLASLGVGGQVTTVFPNYSVGVGFSMPLFDGGGHDASAAAARARADGISAKIRDHELSRTQRDREAALDRDNANRRLEMAHALLESCTAQLAEAEARYDLGGSGIEPIAVARAMMRRAQTELLLAKIARTEAVLSALP